MMIARLSRLGALALTLLCVYTAAASAQTSSSNQTRTDTKSIVPILEADHSHYTVGQPILLRTSVRNTTANTYSMMFSGPYNGTVNVTVRDASGTVIQTKDSNVFYLNQGGSMPLHTPLAPRQTIVLNWGCFNGDKWVEQPWVDLSNWGYSPLEPGTYTITVDLRNGGRQKDSGTTADGESSGDHFLTVDASGHGPMSSVTITVEPASHQMSIAVRRDAVRLAYR
jgi:hypothetical protein